MKACSASVSMPMSGTSTPPAREIAIAISTYSMRFSWTTATRSPGFKPDATSARASREARASSSR
jgi:hypothetical protein